MVETQVSIMYWVLSAIILVSGFMVVSLKNIFHSAISLIICLSGVAGIYILLDAEFLAAVQVLIYVGAVSVLMMFAIMLTHELASRKIVQVNHNALVAFFVCVMFGLGTFVLLHATRIWKLSSAQLPERNAFTIGKLLMTDYMLPFEVVSVLMLAALIGAIVLAREEKA
jgi:NADH-quinone oxidoreductase subunit J